MTQIMYIHVSKCGKEKIEIKKKKKSGFGQVPTPKDHWRSNWTFSSGLLLRHLVNLKLVWSKEEKTSRIILLRNQERRLSSWPFTDPREPHTHTHTHTHLRHF
jgi:hypothetical protein